MASGSRGGDSRRVTDVPGSGMRRSGERAHRADAELATGKGAQSLHRVPGPPVTGRVRLEQGQRPLRALGRPDGEDAPVGLVKGQRAGLSRHDRSSLANQDRPAGAAPGSSGRGVAVTTRRASMSVSGQDPIME
jgi:hypothetical protein